jgi:hypothetical protein
MWAVVEVSWAAGGSEEGICGQGYRDSAPHKSLHPSVLQKLRFQWFLGSVRDRNRTPKSAESKIETEPKKQKTVVRIGSVPCLILGLKVPSLSFDDT